LFWAVVGVIGLVEAAILLTALRIRPLPGERRSPVGSRGAEMVWTLMPTLLLLLLVVLSYQALRDRD